MKRLSYVIGIIAIFSMPAYADDLCREEAKAIGYVAPLDMLAPCEQQATVASEQLPNEPQHKAFKTKPDSQAVAQLDANAAH